MWTDCITCSACSRAHTPLYCSLAHTPSLSCSACSHHSLPLLCSLAPPLHCTLACFAASFPSLSAHLHSAKKRRCCSPPLLLSSLSFICHFLIPFFMWSSQWQDHVYNGLFKHKNHWNHPASPIPFPSIVFCIYAFFRIISADVFCALLRIKMADFRQFSLKEHNKTV